MVFKREDKLRFTLRELKYMDKREYGRTERIMISKAISILGRHLRNNNFDFRDDEFDCLADAIMIKTNLY